MSPYVYPCCPDGIAPRGISLADRIVWSNTHRATMHPTGPEPRGEAPVVTDWRDTLATWLYLGWALLMLVIWCLFLGGPRWSLL